MSSTEPGEEIPGKVEKRLSTGSLDKADRDSESAPEAVAVDPRFAKRTILWIDIRILPLLALIYAFSLIDRINLGSAYAAGMDVSLDLKVGPRYSIVTCLYFVPYVLLQLPGNLMLRKIGVKQWLTFLIVSWGAVQLGMGFVKNWVDLLVTRILLGAFEAPFFPALLWIISAWYRRHEVQKRIAFFYVLSVTAGGLSPLLAYGLSSTLNLKGNLEGWRWIFIVEGLITLFLGVVCYLFVPAFPEESTFLSKEQKEFVINRINDDRGDALPDEITLKKVLTHLSDWTLWAYGLIFMSSAMPQYVQSYFLPIILKGMGYTSKDALLRAVPPYAASIPTTLLTAYLSDKYKHRGGFIIITVVVCCIGNALTAFHPDDRIRYLGAFLTNIGNSSGITTVLAYSVNNVVTHSKRSVQSALLIAFGSIGGILAATCFRSQDSPKYIPGLIATMTSQILVVVLVIILTIRHMYWNKQSREGKLAEPLEGQPGFYYTL